MEFREIEQCAFGDLAAFRGVAAREHVSMTDSPSQRWFVIRTKGGHVASFYSLAVTGGAARFKANYTVPEFRRMGCLARFIEHAKEICRAEGVKRMTAFCTDKSIGSHLRAGAIREGGRGGYVFVCYKL